MPTDNEKARRAEDLKASKLFKSVKTISRTMDDWCLDPLLGLIPYIGDLATPIMSIPYLYISIFRLRSLPLTLAFIYNTLTDCAIGLIPWLGNIFDFFNKSYIENLQLLEGYIANNDDTRAKIRRKTIYLSLMILLLLAIIIGMIVLIGNILVWIGETIFSWIV